MKRIVRYLIAVTALVSLLAVSALAISVNYTLEKGTLSGGGDSTGVYKIVARVVNPGKRFSGFKQTATFDNTLIVPVNAKTGNPANISAGVATPIAVATYYDEVYEETKSVLHAPGSPKWVIDGNNVTIDVETYFASDTITIAADNLVVFEMYFRFAEGKSAADLTKDSFVVTCMAYGDEGDHFYGEDDQTKNDLILNIDIAPTATTIPVPANSHVYFQDSSNEPPIFVETARDVEVPKVAGYIVVNTGYTSQVQYKVNADGSFEQVKFLNDALLGSEKTGLRTTDRPGIRFYSSISDAAKLATTEANDYEIYEYGYIVTVENEKTGLTDGGYTLDLALVEAGQAKQGVSYYKENGTIKKDIVFEIDPGAGKTIFTGVLHNVPETKEALTTYISARTYYKAKDAAGKEYVVYGQITRNTIYNVAKAIKDENGPDYTKNQEYIDKLISIVGEDTGVDGPNIDISELFSE